MGQINTRRIVLGGLIAGWVQKDQAMIDKMFDYGVIQELPEGTWIEIQEVGPTFYKAKIRQTPNRKEREGWEVYVPHDIVFEK